MSTQATIDTAEALRYFGLEDCACQLFELPAEVADALAQAIESDRRRLASRPFAVPPALRYNRLGWTWIPETRSWAPACCRVLRIEEMAP